MVTQRSTSGGCSSSRIPSTTAAAAAGYPESWSADTVRLRENEPEKRRRGRTIAEHTRGGNHRFEVVDPAELPHRDRLGGLRQHRREFRQLIAIQHHVGRPSARAEVAIACRDERTHRLQRIGAGPRAPDFAALQNDQCLVYLGPAEKGFSHGRRTSQRPLPEVHSDLQAMHCASLSRPAIVSASAHARDARQPPPANRAASANRSASPTSPRQSATSAACTISSPVTTTSDLRSSAPRRRMPAGSPAGFQPQCHEPPQALEA